MGLGRFSMVGIQLRQVDELHVFWKLHIRAFEAKPEALEGMLGKIPPAWAH
jgi:hypothetical protein